MEVRTSTHAFPIKHGTKNDPEVKRSFVCVICGLWGVELHG